MLARKCLRINGDKNIDELEQRFFLYLGTNSWYADAAAAVAAAGDDVDDDDDDDDDAIKPNVSS